MLLTFCSGSCVEDLAVYIKALKDCLLRIPPDSFSKVSKLLHNFVSGHQCQVPFITDVFRNTDILSLKTF